VLRNMLTREYAGAPKWLSGTYLGCEPRPLNADTYTLASRVDTLAGHLADAIRMSSRTLIDTRTPARAHLSEVALMSLMRSASAVAKARVE
jgi:hypothetical protein